MSPDTSKRYTYGTHRACSPEETLERVAPFMARAGITRVADLTRMDEIGIPVYQAIRPNSRTLSVSQGKGVTPQLAKVSAIMESLESWHAEELQLPTFDARVREVQPELSYALASLLQRERHFLHPGLKLAWVPARMLDSDKLTYVPRALVELDYTVRMDYAPSTFEATSNGLASGNIKPEAILHGLLEVVERDALARALQARWPWERFVNPSTIENVSNRRLLEQLTAAGASFLIYDATGPSGLPCFRVSIWSEALPEIFSGAGCHLDKDIALSRAITEAAQTRLTLIAGARDDLEDASWLWSRDLLTAPLVTLPRLAPPSRDFRQLPSMGTEDLQEDLTLVIQAVRKLTGTAPLMVDLTRADIGIPVVFVLAPGLRLSHEVHG